MTDYDSLFTDEELQNISKEFTRLKDKTYLDHAGAALCAETQIKNISNDLSQNLYPNPHTSKYTNDCIDQVRYQILNHFNTDDTEYSVIFTSGATSSLKLVAECFEYDPKIPNISKPKEQKNLNTGAFVYMHDNHTSVLGMRDVAVSRSADIVDISRNDLMDLAKTELSNDSDVIERALFVYPAQCNFNGYKYPLKWIQDVNQGALNKHTKNKINKVFYEWATLLDAAAFVSTNKLDLFFHKPDFVCISFYKIFGFPTGLGALLVKNTSADLLSNKIYYGGGTVEISMSRKNYHVKRDILHERFEDGTIPFLSILALKHGFDALNEIIPKKVNGNLMDTISSYTFYLSRYFYQQAMSLHHFNDKPVFVIYADSAYDDLNTQGGIINFNLLRANGEFIGYAEVMHMAELFNIILRSGCFCNPGACQRLLNLSDSDLLKHHKAGHKCGDNNDLIDGIPTGSLRISFGYMSTVKDIDAVFEMILKCFVEGSPVYKQLSDSKVNGLELLSSALSQSSSQDSIKLENEISNKDKKSDKYFAIGALQSIYIYPIKSCGAYKVEDEWDICSKGLKYDRNWMIVDESGVALTQKHDTRMSLIKPKVDLQNDLLKLTFPGVKNISIPLNRDSSQELVKNNLCHSKVCGDKIQGYDCGDGVAKWLLDVLGLPGLRLLRQADTNSRIKKSKSDDANESLISLSNQAQYLLVNIASVKWLSSKVKSKEFENRLDNLIQRFRANFIVEANKEFEELKWQKLKIGANFFDVQGPCTRCQMICIDQESGEKTTEPLRTISKELKGKLNFGIYITNNNFNRNNNQTLKIGDSVSKLSTM